MNYDKRSEFRNFADNYFALINSIAKKYRQAGEKDSKKIAKQILENDSNQVYKFLVNYFACMHMEQAEYNSILAIVLRDMLFKVYDRYSQADLVVGTDVLLSLDLDINVNATISSTSQNAFDLSVGDTPLIFAVELHLPELVDVIIGHKASINAQNDYGETALIVNSKFIRDEKDIAILNMLLDAGANTMAYDFLGDNAISIAENIANQYPNNKNVKYVKKAIEILKTAKQKQEQAYLSGYISSTY